MLRVTHSIEITEMEFSPFHGQPLSSGIRNHLAGKLCCLLFFFLGTLWSDTTSRRRHDLSMSVLFLLACVDSTPCGSSDDTIGRRDVRQMCVARPSRWKRWFFLWISTNQNMDPNPELWLCWDPKFSLMPDKIAMMLVKLIPITGVALLICEARIWLNSYWTF